MEGQSLTIRKVLELMGDNTGSVFMGVYTDDSYDEDDSHPADLLTDHRGTAISFQWHREAASAARDIKYHTSTVNVHPCCLSDDDNYVFYVFATNEIRDAVHAAYAAL